ncbi:MAG: hypothetical protein AAF658_05370 [Myxococcota bacterium]
MIVRAALLRRIRSRAKSEAVPMVAWMEQTLRRALKEGWSPIAKDGTYPVSASDAPRSTVAVPPNLHARVLKRADTLGVSVRSYAEFAVERALKS